MKMIRRCVYPKDIQRITGKTKRSGERLLERIRKQMKKEPHQYVTDEEFAVYTGIPLEMVRSCLEH